MYQINLWAILGNVGWIKTYVEVDANGGNGETLKIFIIEKFKYRERLKDILQFITRIIL